MNLFESAAPKETFIAQLKVGDHCEWYYRVVDMQKKKKKDGGDFISLVLMDKTGKMPAKIWERVEEYGRLLQVGAIYRIGGEVNEYNQKKEMRIQHLRPITAQDSQCRESDFNETATFDTAALFAEMIALLQENVQHPALRRLVDEFAGEFRASFANHYGAQKLHHAYLGGLLEHTLQIIRLALFLAPLYGLDRELLVIGALFHDLGKTAEFQIRPAPELTLAGGLLGHVILSNDIFLRLKNRIADFPEEMTVRIQHLIIAHHGEKEFGAAEVPKTAEAYALHLVDMLDSRMNIFRENRRQAEPGKIFTEYISALGTRILADKRSE